MIMTTDDLLTSTKLKSMAPMSQITFKDQDIVNMLNEEQVLSLLPIVQKMKENYFLKYKNVALVAGVENYPVPERAIAGTLRDVFYLDTGGRRTQIKQIKVSDVDKYQSSGNQPCNFIMYGDNIKLLPKPYTSTGSIQFWYYSRPSDLVLTKFTSRIVGIDDLMNGRVRITTDLDLSQYYPSGSKIDVITQTAPVLIAAESVLTLAAATNSYEVLKLDVTDDQGLYTIKVGQVVALEGKTNTPIFPQEMHPILSQMGAARIVESLSDQIKAQMVQAKLAQMLENAKTLIMNRIENETPTVVKSNGFLQSHRRGWFR